MKNFKTLAIFTYPNDYAVLKLLLEQNEVRHVFQNELAISVLPFHSNAFGGIRLNVYKDDVPLAQTIMDQLNNNADLTIV